VTESSGPVAALVSVGNELLYGETVDTNAAWLARSLAALGLPVVRKYTVGDVRGEIREAVRAATAAADLVVVSGGLGPTSDDVTKEAVAELLGRELRLDRELVRALEERFRARGYATLPTPNVSQAEVPAGATVLRNPHGTAPGLVLEASGSLVVLLPGVPRELRGIFEGDLATALRERFAGRLAPVHHRVIHTTGVPESRLAELLEPRLPADMGPVKLAYLPDLRGVDLRLSAKGVSEQEAHTWFDRIEHAIEPVVREWRFEAPSGDAAEALLIALEREGKRLAVAESCTGGLVAKRLTDHPGASRVFAGGVVAYDNEVKVRELGVPETTIRREGAVSEPVARRMALGAAERFGVAAAVGVTGVAGPGGGTESKPVGTVWVGLALDGTSETRLLQLVGDRHSIRERAAQEAIASLLRLLRRSFPGS
jgi:nicotinamide-nucleotide amidase